MELKHVKIAVVNLDGTELVMRHSSLGHRGLDALTRAARVYAKMATSSIEEFNMAMNEFDGLDNIEN